MKKTSLLSIPAIGILLYFFGAFYSLSESSVEDVVICSTNSDTHHIPSGVCEYYLFNYRSTNKDIAELELNSGLAFFFGIDDKEKRSKYIVHFLEHGASIDKHSHIDGLTPLHAAILLNEADLVKLIIDQGADLNQVELNSELTPLDFLKKIESTNTAIDRSQVSKVLHEAMEKRNSKSLK
ncbi:ankyrin repeat domain-containing protein [Pseudoalteromonas sp. CO325X]|uniref:ankyrin repeat domain-containing protein n=1 Tax=Pseudoalteromonas sp. CO325X TaxID=1777262 RepID=UPI001022ADDE|nr:ankyrin repeat domain-containing protein [Pseudoalteromonas sp. CO325X]RZF80555.1 ankyrin repeat domain-containing protein [Pseudoalteromonas sp. CO325X]